MYMLYSTPSPAPPTTGHPLLQNSTPHADDTKPGKWPQLPTLVCTSATMRKAQSFILRSPHHGPEENILPRRDGKQAPMPFRLGMLSSFHSRLHSSSEVRRRQMVPSRNYHLGGCLCSYISLSLKDFVNGERSIDTWSQVCIPAFGTTGSTTHLLDAFCITSHMQWP